MEDDRENRQRPRAHHAAAGAPAPARARGDGRRHVHLGEPTLNPNLPTYLRWARQLGYRHVGLTTNARRLWLRALRPAAPGGGPQPGGGLDPRPGRALARRPDPLARQLRSDHGRARVPRGAQARAPAAPPHLDGGRAAQLPQPRAIYQALGACAVDQYVFNVMQPLGRGARLLEQLVARYRDIAEEFGRFLAEVGPPLPPVYLVDLPRCTTESLPDQVRGYVEFAVFTEYERSGKPSQRLSPRAQGEEEPPQADRVPALRVPPGLPRGLAQLHRDLRLGRVPADWVARPAAGERAPRAAEMSARGRRAGRLTQAVVAREAAATEERHWVRLTRRCNNHCLFCHDSQRQDGTLLDSGGAPGRDPGRAGPGRDPPGAVGGRADHPPRVPRAGEVRPGGGLHLGAARSPTAACSPMTSSSPAPSPRGCARPRFSMHGHTAELHDYLVGARGAFVQGLRGLTNLLAAGLVVSVDVVVSRPNVRHLADLLRFYLGLGVREFDLLHLIPFGRGFDEFRDELFYDEATERPFILEALRVAERDDVHLWTNRWPAPLLEGAEQLIQDPHKIQDEYPRRLRELRQLRAPRRRPRLPRRALPPLLPRALLPHAVRHPGGAAGGLLRRGHARGGARSGPARAGPGRDCAPAGRGAAAPGGERGAARRGARRAAAGRRRRARARPRPGRPTRPAAPRARRARAPRGRARSGRPRRGPRPARGPGRDSARARHRAARAGGARPGARARAAAPAGARAPDRDPRAGPGARRARRARHAPRRQERRPRGLPRRRRRGAAAGARRRHPRCGRRHRPLPVRARLRAPPVPDPLAALPRVHRGGALRGGAHQLRARSRLRLDAAISARRVP